MLTIVQASTTGQIDQVRELIRGFLRFARTRYRDRLDLMDKYFAEGIVEPELAGLPGRYAPPKGSLLLAMVDGEPAACVGMRGIGEGVCEMKRMFVEDAFQGRGVGRALAVRLLADARLAGYRTMRLDTGSDQPEAVALYVSLGFKPIAPYYDVPDDLRTFLKFYELTL